jgi:hypothetical protein
MGEKMRRRKIKEDEKYSKEMEGRYNLNQRRKEET